MKFIKKIILTVLVSFLYSISLTAQKNNQNDLIGTYASDFTVTDINGNEYSLNNLKGKIIVMNFWFIECKPCIREMPQLNNLVKKYKNKEVVFLGFSGNGKLQIDSFLKTQDFFYSIVPNSRKIASKYKVSGYPTNIIIDKNLKIAYASSGLKPTTINNIEKTIEHLIKK
ncbi:TlpA family protein disulfide reductase [Tenacibaculum sp. nBUS_03]|uniref:TlpA family protein disulfide reductase n=1 Tax=Tenacibaculum sp. nBUS_03 TaxID=3395320 RepID=UPI003EBA3285